MRNERRVRVELGADGYDIVVGPQAIDELASSGRPTEEARTGWWHKISGPLSTILMPLLAATAAFGLARSGKTLLRACIGMALLAAVGFLLALVLGSTGFARTIMAGDSQFAHGRWGSNVVEIDVLNATPIPAALPLFATGLGVLGWAARRRKRKTVAALAA